MPQTIRAIRPEKQPAWFQAFSSSFYVWLHDPNALAAARRGIFPVRENLDDDSSAIPLSGRHAATI